MSNLPTLLPLIDEHLTPRQRAMAYECEQGVCPVCGQLRGFSVPDECEDNKLCPEPWDVEKMLLPPETLR